MCKTHSYRNILHICNDTQGWTMKNPREAECLVTPESFAEKQVNLRGLFFGVTVMDVEGEIYKNLEFTIWL